VLMDGSWNGLVVDRILGSRPRLTDIAVRRPVVTLEDI
jgi:hypothetical protein